MKRFWSTFIVSLLFFSTAIFLGSYSYLKASESQIHSQISGARYQRPKDSGDTKKTNNTEDRYTSLDEAFKDSNRVNIIILGMEDIRTDSIIFASVDLDNKKVDGISIPRDTYIHRKGYDGAEQRKINAIYGDHGIGGVKKALSHILEGAPIHHYIMMDYEGVENIVDAIGGVEVMVPFPMKYRDPTADPPLNIDIKEGRQVLDGKDSLNFLRYRKGNNKKGYIDGDLGRIKAQQQFIQSFIKKSLSYRLPIVVRKGFKYVKTDIKLTDGLAYATKAIGIKPEDFSIVTLPGEGELRPFGGKLLSYFIYDPYRTKDLLEDIYDIKKPPNH